MTTTRAIPTEHQEQAAFFQEVFIRFHNRDDFYPELLYASMNGMWAGSSGDTKEERGRKRFALIAKYKAAGMKTGIPDISYDAPRGGYNKFFCEMKRSDRRDDENGGLSDKQIATLNAARKAGAYTCVCYCSEDAVEEFSKYMAMKTFPLARGDWGIFNPMKG